MNPSELISEEQLAVLARKYRENANISRAQAARDMGIKQPSIFHAEESPEKSYTKLRRRMIEAYSDCEVIGPVYLLRKKG